MVYPGNEYRPKPLAWDKQMRWHLSSFYPLENSPIYLPTSEVPNEIVGFLTFFSS
ncbi:MAG: hypothetical protein BAJATHORv1_10584 [Candidatus Thorarchaeota archaeon]|nr:MAG: hypothetical protein BAJATHORv1_10584 [Candidatus Thorarchaeota archaeon]